jgi:hypothetical protein
LLSVKIVENVRVFGYHFSVFSWNVGITDGLLRVLNVEVFAQVVVYLRLKGRIDLLALQLFNI